MLICPDDPCKFRFVNVSPLFLFFDGLKADIVLADLKELAVSSRILFAVEWISFTGQFVAGLLLSILQLFVIKVSFKEPP